MSVMYRSPPRQRQHPLGHTAQLCCLERPPPPRTRGHCQPTPARSRRRCRSANHHRRQGIRRSRRRTSSPRRPAPPRAGAAGRTPPAAPASRRRLRRRRRRSRRCRPTGMPTSVSAAEQARASQRFSTMTAMSPASTRLPSNVAVSALSSAADIGGEIPADVVAQFGDRDDLGAVAAEHLPRYHPQPERVVVWRTGKPAAVVVGIDVVNDDSRVAQLGAAQHRLQPADQGSVAAAVGAQGLLLARGLRRAAGR